MKKLWIAIGILAVMTAGVFLNCRYVDKVGAEMIGLLEQAETAVRSGDWAQAEAFIEKADRLWENESKFLHITLRHSDTNEVAANLAEVRGFLTHREESGYAAANARLRNSVKALLEMERLTLTNLL